MKKKRILIVDDEKELRQFLGLRLESEGFEVLMATDGMEGYEKARQEMPDLMVLDLMLPKLDGYKVCRMLKFDEKYKAIPIILVTARSQESDQLLGMQVGANAYITKPYDAKELMEKIKELL
ncbi:MAG: response regulator [Candidatus Omnitrophica bacterium]|nr:response regulator [Candidatus Omnitrophota bacterium]